MEHYAEIETLSDLVPLELGSEGEGEESKTANNLDQPLSNEDWSRYAGHLAFAVEKAEVLVNLLKEYDDIIRSQFLLNVSSTSSTISNI